MKVFFSTSPRTKTQYPQDIAKIYETFKDLNVNLTDDTIQNISEEKFYAQEADERKKYYEKTLRGIKQADIAVFEASLPSLGVGHLIDQALNFGKPVIVLYTKGKKPFMLDSANLDKVALVEYTTETVKKVLAHALDFSKDKMDIRFNFFISPELTNYLDWITRNKNIPRSVFLRSLIEEHIRKDKEYLEATN